MKAKKITHSKVKSTGLLFELLVRQITADTLSKKDKSPALDIMQKYFNTSTELGKELQLYRALAEPKKLTETKAIHFIDLVVQQRKKLNERRLAREKYNLIKEIKYNYELKDFLGCKIPDYALNASIYKTFSAEDTDIVNIKDVATARFTLIEHLTANPVSKKHKKTENEILMEEYREQPEEMRMLTYKVLIDRFNEKYQNLNIKQKVLLREYINNTANTTTLYDYIKNEVPRLKKQIAEKSKTLQDRVTIIKLNEVVAQLDKIGAHKNVIRENEIAALLIGYQILKEID